jgi:Flp pilus assembly protein TadG
MATMRNILTNKSGAAAAEFAICLPLLITLVIGVAEFGRVLWCHQVLVQMARDATRYMTRVPMYDPVTGNVDSTKLNAYEQNATNLALYGSLSTGSPLMPASYGAVTLTFVGPTDIAPTGAVVAWSAAEKTQSIGTKAAFTFTSTLISWLNLAVTIPMTVTHTERIQTD